MKKWKELSLYEKGKKIAKYTLNIMTIAVYIIMELAPIWNWGWADKLTDTMIVIMTTISIFLLGGKAITKGKIKGE